MICANYPEFEVLSFTGEEWYQIKSRKASKEAAIKAVAERWENGTGLPDILQIVPLANVFGVSADVLLGIDNISEDDEANR
jgi:hypothetical protein